ncbi:Unknown protein sequence [Pseudomonas syringae pv. maculicola]|nr:Unknown protein sequence [Pseudomonas syringae pv. maculicola]
MQSYRQQNRDALECPLLLIEDLKPAVDNWRGEHVLQRHTLR